MCVVQRWTMACGESIWKWSGATVKTKPKNCALSKFYAFKYCTRLHPTYWHIITFNIRLHTSQYWSLWIYLWKCCLLQRVPDLNTAAVAHELIVINNRSVFHHHHSTLAPQKAAHLWTHTTTLYLNSNHGGAPLVLYVTIFSISQWDFYNVVRGYITSVVHIPYTSREGHKRWYSCWSVFMSGDCLAKKNIAYDVNETLHVKYFKSNRVWWDVCSISENKVEWHRSAQTVPLTVPLNLSAILSGPEWSHIFLKCSNCFCKRFVEIMSFEGFLLLFFVTHTFRKYVYTVISKTHRTLLN